jgi:hypothetical protein
MRSISDLENVSEVDLGRVARVLEDQLKDVSDALREDVVASRCRSFWSVG